MITVDHIRTVYGKSQTLGYWILDGITLCKILELPWKDNKRSISCIPEDIYTVVKMKPTEKRPYEYFHITNVPGRSAILVHPGNFVTQIKGCQLPGKVFSDINRDGLFDVVNSTATLKALVTLLPDKFLLNIKRG